MASVDITRSSAITLSPHEGGRAAVLAGVDPRTVAAPKPDDAPASGWESPVPFDARDLPAFPVQVLPEWMRTWAEAAAEAIQTPVDLPALLALAVVALAVSKRIEAQVKPGWREPLNLYTVIALPPGEGKSPVFREATMPVHAYEREARARLGPEIASAQERRALAEERLKALRSRAVKGQQQTERDGARAEAEQVAAEIAAMRVPALPRLIADDATPEALGRLLHEQGERLGVFSSEGGPIETMAGRHNEKGSNFELFLKGHSGDPCVVDRVNSASYVLHAPALTLALTVQPAVIVGLASNPAFRGKGFLARILYASPASRVGAGTCQRD